MAIVKGNKEKNRIVALIRDVKENGFCYVKSAMTVRAILEVDKNIKAEWDIDEECYTVYYTYKDGDKDAHKAFRP